MHRPPLLAAALSVASAVLCGRVEKGACIAPVENAEVAPGPLSFVTTLVGNEEGAAAAHVWRHGDVVVLTERFTLSAPPSRVHSTCSIGGDEPEGWSVAVTDGEGREVARLSFRVVTGRKLPPPRRVPVEPPPPGP